MVWKSKGMTGTSYIKFEAGKSIEGIFQRSSLRKSPFNEKEELIDIVLDTPDGEKVLGSSSQNLKDVFTGMNMGVEVRIEMVLTNKGRKAYNVFTNEEG